MDNILEIKGLNKSFKVSKNNNQQILNNINIDIKFGEFVAVMGPSGAGKSTFLYSVSGMDTIDSGSIKFNGKELVGVSEAEMASIRLNKMGFIFQQTSFLKDLNIYDNILLPGYKADKNKKISIDKRGRSLIKQCGIEDIANNKINEVSGGQLQRAGVCRALINKPMILFSDEPTGALNSKATDEVMDLLKNINEKGTTVLLVTHDSKVAARAERVIFISDGQIQDECILGKLRDDDLKEREAKLSNWLVVMGF